MFELKHAEKQFIDQHPEMASLFRDGYVIAAFSDSNTIEIIPTVEAQRLGRFALSLWETANFSND